LYEDQAVPLQSWEFSPVKYVSQFVRLELGVNNNIAEAIKCI